MFLAMTATTALTLLGKVRVVKAVNEDANYLCRVFTVKDLI